MSIFLEKKLDKELNKELEEKTNLEKELDDKSIIEIIKNVILEIYNNYNSKNII